MLLMQEKCMTPEAGSKIKSRLKNTSPLPATKETLLANPESWDYIAVLASGPSLTLEDAVAVRDAGFRTIVVNSTWRLAPWYDVLYAGDGRWWRANGKHVEGTGKRYSRSANAERNFNAKVFRTNLPGAYNSGELAVEFACRKRPKLIVMLGFDCSVEHGIHHHGPHRKTPNPNPSRAKKWLDQFEKLRGKYPDAPIVNCSRFTRITCFPCAPLEQILCEPSSISGMLQPNARKRFAKD